MEFVAKVNARGIGMDYLQTEAFALDLPHHLPPLPSIHLMPRARRSTVGNFLVFFLRAWVSF
jgi:hypothetical protein